MPITLDLHDLAAILMHEWSLLEPRFLHARLLEVTNGSHPQRALPAHVPLPILESNVPPGPMSKAFFLITDEPRLPPVTASSFKHTDFTSATSYSDQEIETMFWHIKSLDNGYALAHAMQVVLDSLPTTVEHLRLRTSQGYTMVTPPTAFTIMETSVLPSQKTYVCQITMNNEVGPDKAGLSQYLSGTTGFIPWVYLAFGEGDVMNLDPKLDGRVTLDLAAALLSMRGLGNETFAMEKMVDYHERALPRGGSEIPSDMVMSGRIGTNARPKQVKLAADLSERVLARVNGILEHEERACGYCGAKSPKSSCSRCRQTRYCDRHCQTMGWKYHKVWCEQDVGSGTH